MVRQPAVAGTFYRANVAMLRQAVTDTKTDAANIDLKGFSNDFYFKLTSPHLQPVLDTLLYLKYETDV